MPNLPSTNYDWLNGDLPAYGNGPGGSWMPSYSSSMPSGDSGGGGYASSIGSGAAMGTMIMPGIGTAIGAGAGAISAYFAAKAKKKQDELDRQAQFDLQANGLAQNTQGTALNESQLDPFRQQMSQAKDIGQLDRLERASYKPVRLAMPGNSPYARNMPAVSGGYSYDKSPELMASAGALKKNVMAGNGAPSMTNPDNYGKTSAMDLVSVLAGRKDPTAASSFATGTPSTGSSLGADPVANMIRQGYQAKLGRQASDAEIQSVIGTLQGIYGRPLRPSDTQLVQGWIDKNLATSPEAQAHAGSFQPSYAGMNG